MDLKTKTLFFFFLSALAAFIQGCSYPSLSYGYTPDKRIDEQPLVKKIVVMKPLDMRGHAGTTPVYEAYIPFVPYIRIIEEPEHFVYVANGYNYDYEADFARLVSEDLQASGIANTVVASPDSAEISTLITGKELPDFIIKISIERMDWQTKYSMFGLSIIGFIPQAMGVPNTYGFSYLTFDAQIYDSKGMPLSIKTFSAIESQSGWIYYDSGYLRALTRAYEKKSPDFRKYVSSEIKSSLDQSKKNK
ncbi:MAG TPA: hypothetical protein DD381_09295 [Lentisphaeria bacterium]|nr:MAG: hypothetical protein A2X47_13510 [Lentisphaerae bacterium GWF2_38_69]HBM16518.1 hypothetical protein [Lentisphaeria bacterium]